MGHSLKFKHELIGTLEDYHKIRAWLKERYLTANDPSHYWTSIQLDGLAHYGKFRLSVEMNNHETYVQFVLTF